MVIGKRTKDNWMLHLNLWDAHTPYRAPKEYGNPFENEPLCQDWIDEKIFKSHKYMIGPHGRAEMSLNLYDDSTSPKFPRHPGALHSLDDVKRVLDNYDTGIQYMDSKIGEILQMLKDADVYDDTAIIITSDHGENMGELGIYGDHMTADYVTGKIPMIIKWPNGKKNIREDGFHSNVDLLPTVADLLNVKKPTDLDGTSYAPAILEGKNADPTMSSSHRRHMFCKDPQDSTIISIFVLFTAVSICLKKKCFLM